MAELQGFEKAVEIRLMNRRLRASCRTWLFRRNYTKKSHAVLLSSLSALGFREYLPQNSASRLLL
jgi:hypothetical protein